MNDKEVLHKIKYLTPVGHNKFYWWRRFKVRENVSKKLPLIQKLKTGLLDYSDYRYQALYELILCNREISNINKSQVENIEEIKRSYQKRHNKLMLDFGKDEFELLKYIENEFTRTFKISKEKYYEYIDKCEGGLVDLYNLIDTTEKYKYINIFVNNE